VAASRTACLMRELDDDDDDDDVCLSMDTYTQRVSDLYAGCVCRVLLVRDVRG